MTTIARTAPQHINPNIIESQWFLPAELGITAQMIDDIGAKLWSRLITCRHDLALPGGAFVIVRVNVQPLSNLHGKASSHLASFTDAFDEAFPLWSPADPMGSVELFKGIMNRRLMEALSLR